MRTISGWEESAQENKENDDKLNEHIFQALTNKNRMPLVMRRDMAGKIITKQGPHFVKVMENKEIIESLRKALDLMEVGMDMDMAIAMSCKGDSAPIREALKETFEKFCDGKLPQRRIFSIRDAVLVTIQRLEM